MKIKIISQNQWIFSDSKGEDFSAIMEINTAENTRFGFQILIEEAVGNIDVQLPEISGVEWQVGEMKLVGVDENTAPKLMTTTNYEECKEYVTRQAPFYVYDCILDNIEKDAKKQRSLYVRGRVEKETARGNYEIEVVIQDQQSTEKSDVKLNIYPIQIPDLKEGRIENMNFFSFGQLEKLHQVQLGSIEYDNIFRKYLKLQLELGQTHIMLPLPKVIRDNQGEVVDFDFSGVVRIADLALAAGAKYIVGACVSHWDSWNGDKYHLLWDKEIDVCSTEGYIQLKKYYEKWASIVEQKGYLPYLYHSLADEPQIQNAVQYRALAGIFRKFMPQVPLIEAVEAIELGGALDVWVPKGETFERWREEYEKLMVAGENFWYYTCAFPAGSYMNRSMDLPAVISRYLLWMVPYYGMNGYLHWGFNYYIGENIWEKACCPHKGQLLPAGDAHIIYTLGDQVYPSLRLELQREGRDEAEAFYMIKDAQARKALIAQAVKGQNQYQKDIQLVEKIKKELYREIISQGYMR